MADTFVIREENSDEEILEQVRGRKKPVWGRSLDLWEERGPSREPRSAQAKLHEMMDLYVFCATFLLWSTSIVLTAFSVYILQAEYGIAVLVELDLFACAMVLQGLASLVSIVAALLTTSLIKMDVFVPRRALFGGIAVALMLVILVAETVVGKFVKKEINERDMHELNEKRDQVPNSLSEEAKGIGSKCETWQDKGCRSVYKRHVNIYTGYLIGSAIVAIAIDMFVLPVYIFVYITIKKNLQQDGQITEVSSRLDTPVPSSLLPVNSTPVYAQDEGISGQPATNSNEPLPRNSYGNGRNGR